jgi:chromosome segregation ATPase
MSVREAPQRTNRTKARIEPERTDTYATFQRLQERGERLLQWFPELRKTWQRDAEPNLEALVAQLQALGGQVSRRAKETGRDLEARAERLLADLERQAVRGLGPILSRANLASGTELSDLDTRLADLEARLETAGEERSRLTSGVTDVRTSLEQARAEVSERLREVTVRLAATDEVQSDVGRLHAHLDALSKDQVTRSLEIGKLHDRLVRLEMRMGDVLKEQATDVAARQEVDRRIGELDRTMSELDRTLITSSRTMKDADDHREQLAVEGRATDARLTALISARNVDHDELARITDVLMSIQQTLRQVDLRLGDLGERYAGVREDLAGLSARVSHLELAATSPVSASLLAGRTEGH